MDARRRESPRLRRVVARASRRASRDGDSRRCARDRPSPDASVSVLFAHTSVKRSVAATSWSVCRRSERRSDADAPTRRRATTVEGARERARARTRTRENLNESSRGVEPADAGRGTRDGADDDRNDDDDDDDGGGRRRSGAGVVR